MSIYYNSDIKTDINGDIVLDSKGDLKLANPLETTKSATIFLLRTDFGDYAPDKSVGCNLGSFIGSTNTPSVRSYMQSIVDNTLKNKIFNPIDVNATVVPFDINEVLCLVEIGGSYLIDGVIKNLYGERVVFTFPFIEGSFVKPLEID
jgi:hypothetical protein